MASDEERRENEPKRKIQSLRFLALSICEINRHCLFTIFEASNQEDTGKLKQWANELVRGES